MRNNETENMTAICCACNSACAPQSLATLFVNLRHPWTSTAPVDPSGSALMLVNADETGTTSISTISATKSCLPRAMPDLVLSWLSTIDNSLSLPVAEGHGAFVLHAYMETPKPMASLSLTQYIPANIHFGKPTAEQHPNAKTVVQGF